MSNDESILQTIGEKLIKKSIYKMLSNGYDEQSITPETINGTSIELDDNIRITIKDEFKSCLQNAINNEDYMTAVIMAAIIFEHIFNELYFSLFYSCFNLSNSEIEKALKAFSLSDKVTWLFKIITNHQFEPVIISTITQINKYRNDYIHYKPKSMENIERNNHLINTIKGIEKFIADLENDLDEILWKCIEKNDILYANANLIYEEKFKHLTIKFES